MDRSHAAPPRRRGAFTLIELLVCTSIISLLVGMTMTGLTKARSAARGVVCQSSLRTLAQATNAYFNERNDLPTTAQQLVNLPQGERAIVDMLAPFLDAGEPDLDACTRPWACPNDQQRWMVTGGTYLYYPAGIYTNYGLHAPFHNLRSLLNRNPRMLLFLDGLLLHGGSDNAVGFDGAVTSRTGPIVFNI